MKRCLSAIGAQTPLHNKKIIVAEGGAIIDQ
jgi:hypothetical protein